MVFFGGLSFIRFSRYSFRDLVCRAFAVVGLRWGCVFLEQTQIVSGIQFTTHCIEFLVVESNRFVGSFENVILTRQTCGQRSSRSAESKRRALKKKFRTNLLHVPTIKL